jgi:hypothetical protein
MAGTASGAAGATETVNGSSGALDASGSPSASAILASVVFASVVLASSALALAVLAALALVPLAALDAGAARPRFVAGNGASPDGSTLTSATGVATNRGVRFEALAQASS